jgi:hypothetical protein
MRYWAFIISLILTLSCLKAQTPAESIFRHIEIRTDTLTFNSNRNFVTVDHEKTLYFVYNHEDEIAELAFFPLKSKENLMVSLIPSGDYDVVDSLILYQDAWRCKIRFKNLTRSRFLKIQVKYTGPDVNGIESINLLPCTQTTLSFNPVNDELFIGEEKAFDLITNHADNIKISGDWVRKTGLDYRLERQNDQIRLYVVPNELGPQKLSLSLTTEKPFVDVSDNRIIDKIPTLEHVFDVKTSRLKFLNIDKRDITMDEISRTQGVEIQLDNSRTLELNKTYRVENQENPGGYLVAEIFTRNYLSNNKVLCLLRTYNYHKNSEGYLYIKEGDNAQYITNFNITPVTTISKISVMHEGGDWKSDLTVNPGETFDVKIEGQALYKARFHFEDLIDLTTDTLTRNGNELLLKLKVPMDISKRRVNLYNYSNNTGYGLTIKEYEAPRPFDYIMVNYGDINRTLSSLHGPVLYDKTIRDITLSFNTNKIDSEEKLYGRQYLTIDLRVTGPNGELIDMKTIPNIVVCPSDRSPRFKYYDKKNCLQDDISINKYIRKSTSDLDDWSKVSLSVKTNADKYGGESQEKDLDIILKKSYKFDIDVSFPAGLITVSKDKSGTSFSKLYGISMAMIAQFSFYQPDKIAKLRPYRFGAGFLALNAFNFQSEDQDLGIVALASFYPTSKNRKLAFPLYIGGGYQLKSEKWMLLLGPGISITL